FDLNTSMSTAPLPFWRHQRVVRLVCLMVALTSWSFARAAEDRLPGRQVKVAAICIGFNGEHDAKLKLALEHLEVAGQERVDIACLPEEFSGTNPEPITGP